MHLITARMTSQFNGLIISQKALAGLVRASERGVRDAVKILKEDNWIEVRQIGGRGTVNAYIVNDRVAWTGKRDGIRYSQFSAQVIVTDDDQPDRDHLDSNPPLRRLPSLFEGETQLPAGKGLPPVSQPFLGGMEPDLPATRRDDE